MFEHPTHTHLCVLDFEATCKQDAQIRPQEIIEFPAVMFDVETKNRVSEFRYFVKPVHCPTLTDFCKNLTGIQQDWVDGKNLPQNNSAHHGTETLHSDKFPHVLGKFQEWLLKFNPDLNEILIITCGDWDLKTMLPAQCALSGTKVPGHMKRWCNIGAVYCKVHNPKRRGMAGILNDANIPLRGKHHSGIDDCRNIMSIVEHLLNSGRIEKMTITGKI